MKIILALLLISASTLAQDTLKVSKPVAMKSIASQRDEAERKFISSLSLQQLRLRDNILIIEGQLQAFESLQHDTLKVKK